MVRPRSRRRIRFNPNVIYYKPQGVPLRLLEDIELTTEELEALRLKNVKELDTIDQMGKQLNQTLLQLNTITSEGITHTTRPTDTP